MLGADEPAIGTTATNGDAKLLHNKDFHAHLSAEARIKKHVAAREL